MATYGQVCPRLAKALDCRSWWGLVGVRRMSGTMVGMSRDAVVWGQVPTAWVGMFLLQPQLSAIAGEPGPFPCG